MVWSGSGSFFARQEILSRAASWVSSNDTKITENYCGGDRRMMRLAGVTALSFALFGQETFGFENKKFGFSKQRLQTQHQQDLQKIQADTDCTNVYEYRYTEAVIDNFASLNEQKFWDGEGQRYWLNEEFWGGPGYPVFVFIGGEWVESCYRLTSSVSFS
jgi:hypothetical protein